MDESRSKIEVLLVKITKYKQKKKAKTASNNSFDLKF